MSNLSDEQIERIARDMPRDAGEVSADVEWVVAFARAIESAVREKGASPAPADDSELRDALCDIENLAPLDEPEDSPARMMARIATAALAPSPAGPTHAETLTQKLLEALIEVTDIAAVLEPTCLGDERAVAHRIERARAAIKEATEAVPREFGDVRYRAAIDAVRGAAPSPAGPAPAGWKLVPVEPTTEMLGAAADLSSAMSKKGNSPCGDEYYRAMIGAAPSPAGERPPNADVYPAVTPSTVERRDE